MTTNRFNFQENTEDIEQILSKLDGDSILNTPGIRFLLIFEIELVHQVNLGKCTNQVTFLSLFCEFVKKFHLFHFFNFCHSICYLHFYLGKYGGGVNWAQKFWIQS